MLGLARKLRPDPTRPVPRRWCLDALALELVASCSLATAWTRTHLYEKPEDNNNTIASYRLAF